MKQADDLQTALMTDMTPLEDFSAPNTNRSSFRVHFLVATLQRKPRNVARYSTAFAELLLNISFRLFPLKFQQGGSLKGLIWPQRHSKNDQDHSNTKPTKKQANKVPNFMSATRTSAANQQKGIMHRMSLEKGTANPEPMKGVHVRVEAKKALGRKGNKPGVRLSSAFNRCYCHQRQPVLYYHLGSLQNGRMRPWLFGYCAPVTIEHHADTYPLAIQKQGKNAPKAKPAEGRNDKRGARNAKIDYGANKIIANPPPENWRERVQVLKKEVFQGLGSYNRALRADEKLQKQFLSWHPIAVPPLQEAKKTAYLTLKVHLRLQGLRVGETGPFIYSSCLFVLMIASSASQ